MVTRKPFNPFLTAIKMGAMTVERNSSDLITMSHFAEYDANFRVEYSLHPIRHYQNR